MRDQLYINGQWVRPDLGGRFTSYDPATGQPLREVPAATEEDVDHAVRAARTAFNRGWGQSRGSERAEWLEALAGELERTRTRWPNWKCATTASRCPRRSGMWPTPSAASATTPSWRGSWTSARPDPAPPDERFRCRIRQEPVGVAGQIIPWNYPLLMAAWKVAPALAAGATCVPAVRASTPLSALELAAAADAIGLPAALNVLPGRWVRRPAGR